MRRHRERERYLAIACWWSDMPSTRIVNQSTQASRLSRPYLPPPLSRAIRCLVQSIMPSSAVTFIFPNISLLAIQNRISYSHCVSPSVCSSICPSCSYEFVDWVTTVIDIVSLITYVYYTSVRLYNIHCCGYQ